MTSIADSSVSIQTSSESVPSTPCWQGEVVLIVEHLRKQEVLVAINEHVRFARRRFGHYEVIDFLAVLFGYAISGERTLEAFYERLAPFAEPFMALFNREQLPSRSALSRFLASFTPVAVEFLRRLFLEDLLARPLTNEQQRGELLDRAGGQWEVIDIDGTREAARQRACMQLVRAQHIEVRNASEPPNQNRSAPTPVILSRAQRAHFRLSWTERLMRNAHAPGKGLVSIKLFGVPDAFADFLGLPTNCTTRLLKSSFPPL
jgi:hypothetical protein